MDSKQQPRVLSVQSHVVSGYCGNKSATFPLQLLGFEVDVINTVQYSNHTQYKVTKGSICFKSDCEDLFAGLKANGLLKFYSNIITGYMADADFIEVVAKAIEEIKSVRHAASLPCLYTFDPVLGDDGVGFYVPDSENVARAYSSLLAQCDIVLPNRFEASHLSGIEINSLATCLQAIDYFHNLGICLVVLTSLNLEPEKNELVCIASYCQKKEHQPKKENKRYEIHIPLLDRPFTGTGDLFAALLTAWLHKTDFDVKSSLETTVRTVHAILKDTIDYSQKNLGKLTQPFSYELRLVANKDIIEQGKHSSSSFLNAKEIVL